MILHIMITQALWFSLIKYYFVKNSFLGMLFEIAVQFKNTKYSFDMLIYQYHALPIKVHSVYE